MVLVYMSQELLIAIVISEIISIILVIRTWKREDYLIFKVLSLIFVFVPIVGPILYLFVTNNVQSQAEHLKNSLPRGSYTHNWISTKPLLKKFIKENSEKNEKKEY